VNTLANKKFWEELIAFFPSYDKERVEKDASTNFSISAYFVSAGTCIPSRCLATIWGTQIRNKEGWEGFIEYAVEIASGAMICTSIFMKIGSGIQKLKEVIHGHTDTQTAK
jgi:hypothetical protein